MISNITHNELMLRSHILRAEDTIKKVELHQTSFEQYYLIHNLINQITLMYQSISNILEKIEIAIAKYYNRKK